MFTHVAVGTNDLQQSKKFYDSVLGSLGYGPGLPREAGGYVYTGGGCFFIISPPLDGNSATPANGGTVSFACQSPEQVERWHAAGIANGGRSVEAAPGVRNTQFGDLYLAYMRDPDGNKLCALHSL